MGIALLVGCSDYGVSKDVTLNDDAIGELSISPDTAHLGALDLGETATTSFVVSATGEVSSTITGLSIEGSSGFTLISDSGVHSLSPGEQLVVHVAYTPMGLEDDGRLWVETDGEPLSAELAGNGLFPVLATDPESLVLEAEPGITVWDTVQVENVGTGTLEVYELLVVGDGFDALGAVPLSLAPGETAVVDVGWTAEATLDDGAEVEGTLWLSANTSGGTHAVPLLGMTPPPWIGLAEAWDRAALDIQVGVRGNFYYKNISEDQNIQDPGWYIVLSDDSQDGGVGPSDTSDGGLTISPGEQVTFEYHGSDGTGWWCVEEDQYTSATDNIVFLGAQVPDLLWDEMAALDQEGVWSTEEETPVIAVGRTTHYAELPDGGTTEVVVRAFNMGQVEGSARVGETIPAGFAAAGFTVQPDATEADAEGAVTYWFDLSFEAAQPSNSGGQTVYDKVDIGYTLERIDGDCRGRVENPSPVAEWNDLWGGAHTSAGSIFSLLCL